MMHDCNNELPMEYILILPLVPTLWYKEVKGYMLSKPFLIIHPRWKLQLVVLL